MVKALRQQPRVAIVDLGCAKNTIDSERALGVLLSGGFVFAGRIWWASKSGYENASGITAYFKDGTPVAVYDNGGNPIYSAAKEGDRSSVYIGAKLVNGKKTGGEFIGAYLVEAPVWLLTKYKEFVVTNVQLNSSGGFQFAGTTQWHTLQGYENATDITAYFKGGSLVAAYNKDGEQIYAPAKEGDRNSIYIKAQIRDGKRVGGTFLAAYPNGCPSQIFADHKEFIATNIELGPRGEFALGHKFFWHGMIAYKKARGITVHIKYGNLIAAYDGEGKQIYSPADKKVKRHVYINAKIENGKRVGGDLVGEYNFVPPDLLTQYQDFIVTDIGNELIVQPRSKLSAFPTHIIQAFTFNLSPFSGNNAIFLMEMCAYCVVHRVAVDHKRVLIINTMFN